MTPPRMTPLPLTTPQPCAGCQRRPALVAWDSVIPLCALCFGVLWAKHELSQPRAPGDEPRRQFFRAFEDELHRQLREGA